jgi:exodeoxyribonuclease-3
VLRLATWNVNSLKARLPRVTEWVAETTPDVLCMQETKMKQEVFPADVFAELGYESAHYGQGQWNGVAIISRVGLTDVVAGWDDDGPEDPEARLLWATCAGVRVASAYVPNGRALDNDHYTYKLAWMARLREALDRREDASGELAVLGDYNIAPEDRDVWSMAAFAGATHVSEPEREALRSLEQWGLTDVFRRFNDEDKVYSWWDYREFAFRRNRGLRIDHILVSHALKDQDIACMIDKLPRKNERPSDHTPVVVTLS